MLLQQVPQVSLQQQHHLQLSSCPLLLLVLVPLQPLHLVLPLFQTLLLRQLAKPPHQHLPQLLLLVLLQQHQVLQLAALQLLLYWHLYLQAHLAVLPLVEL
jgi:hypothetical protein